MKLLETCEKNCAMTKCIRGECECYNDSTKHTKKSKYARQLEEAQKHLKKL